MMALGQGIWGLGKRHQDSRKRTETEAGVECGGPGEMLITVALILKAREGTVVPRR